MAQRHTTELVLGPAGCGKTYSLVKELAEQFFPFEVGQLVTNLPLNVEAIAKQCAPQFWKCHRDKVRSLAEAEQRIRDRIILIHQETFQEWSRERGHFVTWLAEEVADGRVILEGCLILIDEVHNVAGKRHKPETIRIWQEFCGELRHSHAAIKFATQEEHKLAIEIKREAGVQTVLSSADEERALGVRLGDWFQLEAKFISGKMRGGYLEVVQRIEAGRMKPVLKRYGWFQNSVFALYDSHAKPFSEEDAAEADKAQAEKVKQVDLWQYLSRWQLLLWFWGRNWFPLSKWALAIGLMLFVFVGPGGRMMMDGYNGIWSRLSARQFARRTAQTGKVQPIDPVKDASRIVGENDHLRVVNQRLQTELADNSGRLREFENRLVWMSTLAAITKDSITFRNLQTYKVGDLIDDGGMYDGMRVTKISFDKRFAQLNTGIVLRIGGEKSKPCNCGPKEPVSGPVPAGQPPTPAVPPPGQSGQTLYPVGRGNAPTAIRGISGPTNGGVDSGVGQSGFQAVQPIRKRAAASGDSGSSGAAFGSPSFESGGSVLPRRSPARGSSGIGTPEQPFNP